eukprot:11197072-Lingulodinium_polyedra.AAC.1
MGCTGVCRGVRCCTGFAAGCRCNLAKTRPAAVALAVAIAAFLVMGFARARAVIPGALSDSLRESRTYDVARSLGTRT